jgi:hypothetical protein
MKFRSAAIALFLFGASFAPSPAALSMRSLRPPTLSGAVYVVPFASSRSAKPVLGYRVFVSIATSDAPWIGPAFTDEYGRFVFYGLAPGKYLLRIYDANGRRLWQQIVAVPGTLQRIVVVPPTGRF